MRHFAVAISFVARTRERGVPRPYNVLVGAGHAQPAAATHPADARFGTCVALRVQ